MDRVEFSSTVKRKIESLSNCSCMICKRKIPEKQQPQFAHIIPASEKGPRGEFRDKYDEEFIKSEENCLLLCGECHRKIDTDTSNYPPKYLFDINKNYLSAYKDYNFFVNRIFNPNDGINIPGLLHELNKFLNINDKKLKEIIKISKMNDKIDIDKKIELNDFDNKTRRSIEQFIMFDGALYHDFMSDNTEMEIEKKDLDNTMQVLYMKCDNMSEQEKYNKMLQILKEAFLKFDISEEKLLNYYFQICTIFKKEKENDFRK